MSGAHVESICDALNFAYGKLNGKWEMGNGKWEMGNGKWGMGNGRWGMGNGESAALGSRGGARIAFLTSFNDA